MLAIVIPYYKLTFFDATLKSLSNQSDQRFNVYIGDDASPENPIELINYYKNQFNLVYQRFENNLGATSLVQQWHRCISMTKNEQWLLVLGDDDVVQDNFVSTFYENLSVVELLNIAVIRYATVVINERGDEISPTHTHPRLETSTDFLMRKLKGGTRSSLSEFIFRKSEFDKYKFKDLPLAWYSDYLAVLETSSFSTLFTINNSLVYFRHSGLNITSLNNNLTTKNKATFEFYYYLLNEKRHFFDCEQINVLMDKLEKSFLDDKKNINFWIRTSKFYALNFYYKRYWLFLKKLTQSIFKKYKILR